MQIGTRKRSRYERRSRARNRRVERRLAQVQARRASAGVRTEGRPLSRFAGGAIFLGSLFVGVGLAHTVTAAAISWWNDGPVILDAIAVQGTDRLTSDEIATATGLSKGSLIDALTPAELEAQVSAHPWVRSARVALLPTGTLIVEVDERQARAVLRSPDASGEHTLLRFVDADGIAFARVALDEAAEAARLPALALEAPDQKLSSESDPTRSQGLALLDLIDALDLAGFARAEQAHRGLELLLPASDPGRGWVLRRTDGSTEVILGDGDVASVNERLDRLERLLSAGLRELEAAESEAIGSIDMRFAGQAVLRARSASR
jgi:cell division septal protein FtsQ